MKVHRHRDIVLAVAEYLRDQPTATANEIVATLRCRRQDGLRAVKVVRLLQRLPGAPSTWFLLRETTADDGDLYRETGT